MRPIRLSDFTGGLSEVLAAEDFAQDAVAKAKGFVLDTTVSIRSQWALRSFDGEDFVAIRGFISEGEYLVGIKDEGTVWWAEAPEVDDESTDLVWVQFTSVAAEPSYRFIGEVPIEASSQTTTNEVDGNSISNVATLYGRNGLLISYNKNFAAGEARKNSFVVFETSSGTLSASVFSKAYPRLVPDPTIANLNVPDTNVMPRGNVGVVWGDRLVIADIEWFDQSGVDTTLTESTASRYKNAMWFSEAGQVTTFDPLNVVVPCSSDAQIVGLAALDVGLLVMTTDASGRDGLVLLRGTSGSFRIEVLRSRLSAPERTSDEHRNFADVWTETGSAVMIDRQGGIWQTNGVEVARLDGSTLASYGPADEDDHCASVGRWLFVSRGTRMLVMRSFGEQGAWTELVVPGKAASMTRASNGLWFLVAGVPYRFAVGATSAVRGTLNGSELSNLVLASPTLSIEQKGDAAHQRALWHRVGVRARGRGDASLDTVRVNAGPALDATVPSHVVSPAAPVSSRFELVVPAGIGFAVEASAELSFSGDVEVESMSLWVSGGEPVR